MNGQTVWMERAKRWRKVTEERDAALAVIRDAMAEDGDLYGCPYFLTHMVKGVETETCNRGCHDEPACLTSRWGHIQCPDTPEKADAIRRAIGGGS